MKNYSVPTVLTLIRLIAAPCLIPLIIIYADYYDAVLLHVFAALCFLALSFTDFLDGYLARKLHQETIIGKILDPIADKFLLYATLIALLTVHRIAFYWVIILIGREFFVMGLRLVAVQYKFDIPVSYMAKIKTVLQMMYLTLLIVEPIAHYYKNTFWLPLETIVLAIVLYLSIGSAYIYYKNFMRQLHVRLYEGTSS